MESSITLIKVGFVFLEENKRIFESENLFILNSSFGDKEYIFNSVQFSHSVVSDSLRPHESQHARPPCPSPTPGVHSDSRSSSQ